VTRKEITIFRLHKVKWDQHQLTCINDFQKGGGVNKKTKKCCNMERKRLEVEREDSYLCVPEEVLGKVSFAFKADGHRKRQVEKIKRQRREL